MKKLGLRVFRSLMSVVLAVGLCPTAAFAASTELVAQTPGDASMAGQTQDNAWWEAAQVSANTQLETGQVSDNAWLATADVTDGADLAADSAEPTTYVGMQGLNQTVTLYDVSQLPASSVTTDVLFYGESDEGYDNRFQTAFDANQDISFAFGMGRGNNANGGDGTYQLSFSLPYISVLDESGATVATYDNGNGVLQLFQIVFDGKLGKTSGNTITAVNIGLRAGTLDPGTYTLRFGSKFGANNGISFLGKNVDFHFTVKAVERYTLSYEFDQSNHTATLVGYATTVSDALDVEIPQTVTDSAGETYTVTSIGERAFANAQNIASIRVPASVKSIGDAAFANIPTLTRVMVLANGDAALPEWGESVFAGDTDVVLYGYATSSAQAEATAEGLTFAPLEDGVYINHVLVQADATCQVTKDAANLLVEVIADAEIVTTDYTGYLSNTNVARHATTAREGWSDILALANGTTRLVLRDSTGSDAFALNIQVTGFDADAATDRVALNTYQGNGCTVRLDAATAVETVTYDETLCYFDDYIVEPLEADAATFAIDIGGPGSAWGPSHAGWNWEGFLANINGNTRIETPSGQVVATIGDGLSWTSLPENASEVVLGVDAGVLEQGATYVLVLDEGFSGHNVAATLSKAVHWTFETAESLSAEASTSPVSYEYYASLKCTTNVAQATYQWQWRSSTTGKWKNCTFKTAQKSTMKLYAKSYRLAYEYRCVVTAPDGTQVSTEPIHIQSAYATTTPVAVGKSASFACTTTVDGVTYRWQYRTSATGSWKYCTTFKTQNDAVFKPLAKKYRLGYQYRCVLTDANGKVFHTNALSFSIKD